MDQPGETFIYDSAPPNPPVYDAATLPVNMTYDANPQLVTGRFVYDSARLPAKLDMARLASEYPEADEPTVVERKANHENE